MNRKKILLSLLAGAVGATIMSVSAMAAEETAPILNIEEDMVIEDVDITATEGPAISIAKDADVTLTIKGENYVEGAKGFAGIYVPVGSTLTIVGDGTLEAVGGDAAEIKSDDHDRYNLKYNYSAGAGIGGNGSYFMSDRKNSSKWTEEELEKVYTDIAGKQYLVVSNANFGIVTVDMDDDGYIVARGGDAVVNQGGGAGIGSGGANPQCYMYFDEAGEKQHYPFKGEIIIVSGNVEATGGSSDNANSSNAGAGIGAGCCSQAVADNEIDITISGGVIVATGANDSAAIGGGAHVQGGDITITGGDITAISGEDSQSGEGAGIGAGHMAYKGIIKINGDAVVSATANGNAAGIGAGADAYYSEDTESTDELHCENVIFGGNAQIEFNGGKTTFFTVEKDSNVEFSSSTAVCSIVNDEGVMIGLASSFEEAISVINEFENVTTIALIKDIPVAETVVIEDNITINGNGYTVKGADVTETETNGTAVTPITINGAEVTLINITVKGGNAYNNDPYQPTASHGVAGAAVNVTNGKVTIDNSTLAGGDAGAEYTKSTGSAIVATDSDIIVTNSTLATGRTTRSNVIGVATVYLDDASTIDLTDVVLDTAKSTYASDNVIASFHANGQDTTKYTGEVKLDGEILIRGTRLANVNIVAGENLTFKGNIDPSYISDTLYIQFDKKDIDDAGEDNDEEADLYDIVVYGNKNYINRLNSADLTFILESDTSVKPVYEILPVNPVKITTDADYENRYMFSFDGVTQPDDTAKSIVIGQVKISGYGAYTFKVNGAVDENIVNASETADSIVEHFYVGGKADGKGELDLTTDVDDNGSLTPVINAEIVVPTRDLEIVIDFPNAVAKNAAAYQDMTVTVAGGDLDDAVIIKLGNEAVETKIATEYEKKDAKFTVDVSADNKYTVKVVDILTVNTSYTVTVEGAGYRTARYTVTMNCEESKTLNFWNNVKDNAVEVEEDKETSKKNVTFLAGDIVKDAIINIYDLSAVVSYFGEIDLSETNNKEYAKYDLNRDGKIDSKDVAYVLVSWGK